MPNLNWYLPLERCQNLEEIHAQWDVLLEQNHMAPTYEAPAYQDALLSFLGNSRLSPQLKLAAVLAYGSAFDVDLRLAVGALFDSTLEAALPWPTSVAAAVSDNGPTLHVPTMDTWLAAFVAGRFAGLRETFTHDGINGETWRARYWNAFLEMACRHAAMDGIRLALRHGADPLANDGAAIRVAANGTYLYDIRMAVDIDPGEIDARYERVLLQLLDSRAKRSAILTIALSAAAAANNTSMLVFLIAQGADLGADRGRAASAAARQLAYDAFECLLRHGVDMRADGHPVLAAAVATLDETMVDMVITAGADLHGIADSACRIALDTQPWDLYSIEAELTGRRAHLIAALLRQGARPAGLDVVGSKLPHEAQRLMELAQNHSNLCAEASTFLKLVELVLDSSTMKAE